MRPQRCMGSGAGYGFVEFLELVGSRLPTEGPSPGDYVTLRQGSDAPQDLTDLAFVEPDPSGELFVRDLHLRKALPNHAGQRRVPRDVVGGAARGLNGWAHRPETIGKGITNATRITCNNVSPVFATTSDSSCVGNCDNV